MTTFASLEPSVESSRPFEIYTVALGTQPFLFTNNSRDTPVGSDTYRAIAISRTSTGQGKEERRRQMTIRMPADEEFARNYSGVYVPGVRASVTIHKLQRDEVPTYATRFLMFKGHVENVRVIEDGNVAEIVCRSIEASGGKSIPLYTCQGLCNHVLYGPGCGISQSAFRVDGTISSVLVNVLTIPGLNAYAAQWFRGGFVSLASGGDHRLIVSHTGNDLVLNVPFGSDALNADVVVYPGCNHRYDGDCGPTKFDNRPRFNGFPFVPTKNPFATGLL